MGNEATPTLVGRLAKIVSEIRIYGRVDVRIPYAKGTIIK